jgi:hypothetical protein
VTSRLCAVADCGIDLHKTRKMAKAPQTAQPPKTALAQIYSHPYGEIGGVNHNPIANILPYKSGLSPSTLPPNATPQDKIERAALERYQKKRFEGMFLSIAIF